MAARRLARLVLSLVLIGCRTTQPSPRLTLDSSGVVYKETELDRPVRPIDIPTPEYPQDLQGLGAEGHVRLEYIVAPDGRVEPASIRVVSATYSGFGEEAAKAIRAAVFRPGVKAGKYVRTKVQQLITFQVSNR